MNCDGGIGVAQDLGQGLDVHSALDCTCREGVAEAVKGNVADTQLVQHSVVRIPVALVIKWRTVGTGNYPAGIGAGTKPSKLCHHVGGKRDLAIRGSRLGGVGHLLPGAIVVLRNVNGLVDADDAALKVQVLPLKGQQLPHPKPCVKVQHDPEPIRIVLPIAVFLDQPLFFESKALEVSLGDPFRASDSLGRIGGQHVKIHGVAENELQRRQYRIDRRGRQRLSGVETIGFFEGIDVVLDASPGKLANVPLANDRLNVIPDAAFVLDVRLVLDVVPLVGLDPFRCKFC